MKLVQTIKEKFLNKQFITFGIIGAINTLSSQLFYMLFVFLLALLFDFRSQNQTICEINKIVVK